MMLACFGGLGGWRLKGLGVWGCRVSGFRVRVYNLTGHQSSLISIILLTFEV